MTEPDVRASEDALLRGLIEPIRRYLARRTDPADVDDALVETLTIVWRRHREAEPTLLLPWVYGVARGVLANQYRGRRRRAALSERVRVRSTPLAASYPARTPSWPSATPTLPPRAPDSPSWMPN